MIEAGDELRHAADGGQRVEDRPKGLADTLDQLTKSAQGIGGELHHRGRGAEGEVGDLTEQPDHLGLVVRDPVGQLVELGVDGAEDTGGQRLQGHRQGVLQLLPALGPVGGGAGDVVDGGAAIGECSVEGLGVQGAGADGVEERGVAAAEELGGQVDRVDVAASLDEGLKLGDRFP